MVSVAIQPAVPLAPADRDQFVVLQNVPWDTYCELRARFDGAGVRMTYLEGVLEIMRPSKKHERGKKRIARFVEISALERDVPLYGYGSATLRQELAARGLEPDECWSFGRELSDADDDVPDLALEVVVTGGGINKLEVYAGLGVPEVWYWHDDVLQVYVLDAGTYRVSATSRLLPGLDLQALVLAVAEPDQHEALKAFRDRLRAG